MSVYAMVFLGTTPIGNSLIGLFADSFGTVKAVTFSGVACIAASLIFTIKIRRQ
jgi:hypothetical protein